MENKTYSKKENEAKGKKDYSEQLKKNPSDKNDSCPISM